ncbi:MAG: hypothetical protein NTV66_07690 [Methylococcales bacterium]|nr:hypothetical protein [Methylococcales bacterium]
MAIGYGKAIVGGGGMPVEFSWPVLPSTVDGSDFEVTLNTGKKVIAQAASINPNLEYNERSTVVVVSPFFGNRTFPGQRGSVYPVKLRIVRDATPLKLVGPRGQIKVAVGMTYGDGKTPMSGYHSGPKLCAAKLSRLSTSGEGGPAVYTTGYSPNDGVSLYGANAQYRLRVLTTGGFSPDGVRSLYPTEYSDFFKIEVKDADGRLFYLTKSNKTYHLKAGSIKILGLADLSIAQQSYDDSYVEDHDNQIDIILQGDEAAMKRIKNVLVPSSSPYKPFYNPGGPGNNPTRGVTYTKPSPSINQAVTIAIDNPMTVNYLGAQ